MPGISLQDAANKYKSNASGAGQAWQDGASRFEGDPTALAAANLNKAKTNYNEAIDSGRVARRLAEAGRSGWLGGINRPESVTAYGAGVSGKGAANWAKSMTYWLPVIQQAGQAARQMPKATTQDSINRVAYMITTLKAAKANR